LKSSSRTANPCVPLAGIKHPLGPNMGCSQKTSIKTSRPLRLFVQITKKR
jgi:hypothetical protein